MATTTSSSPAPLAQSGAPLAQYSAPLDQYGAPPSVGDADLPQEESFSFTKPMVSTKQVPLGTRLFLVSIMLVILGITSYLFFFRTDNVAVSFARNYDPTLFYQPPPADP